jgi:general nucleoside transport system ATP-binding protein
METFLRTGWIAMTYELELRGIVKRFPGVIANDHIDLAVAPGEIRALVGENGAGKTTLMKILYGEYQPDEGEILIREERKSFRSPSDSIRSGLGMIHQQFMLFSSLTVAENVIYGWEPTRNGLIDRKMALSQVSELSEQYGLNVDPGAQVGNLPVGIRQRVEILKTLYRNAQILILDEPTAVLTPQERDSLFVILRGLANQGKTILFITHKLNEVIEISENATVLRNGRVMGTLHTVDTSPQEICKFMVGREVMFRVSKPPAQLGQEVLRLDHVVSKNENGRSVLTNVSMQVRAGEIVGMAGVAGNGQTELIESIIGLRPVDEGQIYLNHKEITHQPVSMRRNQIAYIPEDRVNVGSAVEAAVSENLIMGFQNSYEISSKGFLRLAGMIEHATSLIENFAIKVTQLDEPAANLSGGNLQKMVVARELAHGFPLLIADQPTRGVDVGSIEFIHQQLIDYRSQGKAILLISADLNEVMGLSDRILVLFEGQIVGEVSADEAKEETLGMLMAGAKRDTGTFNAPAYRSQG